MIPPRFRIDHEAELFVFLQSIVHVCMQHIMFFLCVLFSQSPANVKRLSGYDVEPLRIDIMAAIEHSKLVQ